MLAIVERKFKEDGGSLKLYNEAFDIISNSPVQNLIDPKKYLRKKQ